MVLVLVPLVSADPFIVMSAMVDTVCVRWVLVYLLFGTLDIDSGFSSATFVG